MIALCLSSQNISNLTKISGTKARSDPPQRPIILHRDNPFSTRSIFYEDIIHGVTFQKNTNLTKISGSKVWSDPSQGTKEAQSTSNWQYGLLNTFNPHSKAHRTFTTEK